MTLDDKPAPAVVVEEQAVIEYAPPSPPRPANTPKPARKAASSAPDPFAVGVRVLKMAPAWLLVTTLCCSLLVVLLGWMKGGGGASAFTLPSKHNDARAPKRVPASDDPGAKAPAAATDPAPPVKASEKATSAPAEAPAPAPVQPTPPPAQPAQAEEKAEAAPPAEHDAANAKFTAQVGSFNNSSEANERVSALRAAGFEARAVAAELPGRGTWYRVQVGRFADRGEAAKTVAALRAKGAASTALVVPLQN